MIYRILVKNIFCGIKAPFPVGCLFSIYYESKKLYYGIMFMSIVFDENKKIIRLCRIKR